MAATHVLARTVAATRSRSSTLARATRSFSALPAAAPAAAGVSDEAFGALKATLLEFMHERIYPNEVEFLKQCHAQGAGTSEWTHPPLIIDLMREAKAAGLWNLFLPADTAALVGGKYGGGLTNLQYADLCEIMGTSVHAEFAAQATNCTSPDTGNMETIARFGSEAQKRRWLDPLLAGEIRSCFAMTEPDVASSDATNVSVDIRGDGDDYVVNGRKWWITGAGSLHCKVMILMGKTDVDAPPHAQQSMLLVPMDAPGIRLVRPLTVFGDDDAPKGHVEMVFEDLRVPKDSVLWEPGKGFEIAQRRLGPGRIHHCMRAIGQCERALSLMCARAGSRVAFGKPLAARDGVLEDVARARGDIDAARTSCARRPTSWTPRATRTRTRASSSPSSRRWCPRRSSGSRTRPCSSTAPRGSARTRPSSTSSPRRASSASPTGPTRSTGARPARWSSSSSGPRASRPSASTRRPATPTSPTSATRATPSPRRSRRSSTRSRRSCASKVN